MSRYYSYLNSTKQLLQQYNGEEPLSSYLKKFFSANKKFGSRDRRQISHMCYCYFRFGKIQIDLPDEEKILAGLFLCSNESNEILAALKPEWNEKVGLSDDEKLLIINPGSSRDSLLITEVFPWKDLLSNTIEYEKFCQSFFVQPDLFIRVRPGNEKSVLKKLKDAGIDARVSDNCIALPNSSKLEGIIELDKEAVIQDYSSQQTGKFISNGLALIQNKKPIVWDCCAASGGKSIMVYDIDPDINLIVSDIRESILANLKKRFQKAGITNYKSFIADITSKKSAVELPASDIIICDAPCTGSGTWSRTPEQLYFFNEKEIDRYSSLQRKIATSAIPHLQPGGAFIYITCSVFKMENEELVEYIQDKFGLQVKQMEVLKGYDKKADSMFVAVLRSPPQGEKL